MDFHGKIKGQHQGSAGPEGYLVCEGKALRDLGQGRVLLQRDLIRHESQPHHEAMNSR